MEAKKFLMQKFVRTQSNQRISLPPTKPNKVAFQEPHDQHVPHSPPISEGSSIVINHYGGADDGTLENVDIKNDIKNSDEIAIDSQSVQMSTQADPNDLKDPKDAKPAKFLCNIEITQDQPNSKTDQMENVQMEYSPSQKSPSAAIKNGLRFQEPKASITSTATVHSSSSDEPSVTAHTSSMDSLRMNYDYHIHKYLLLGLFLMFLVWAAVYFPLMYLQDRNK